MKNNRLYSLLFTISIICFIGTLTTNIQQYMQYERLKDKIEQNDINQLTYEKMLNLYSEGVIAEKPDKPDFYTINTSIATPYNCLNIAVSIFFWILAVIGVIDFIIAIGVKINCTKSEKIRLYIFSSMALISIIIGVLYWAYYFNDPYVGPLKFIQ